MRKLTSQLTEARLFQPAVRLGSTSIVKAGEAAKWPQLSVRHKTHKKKQKTKSFSLLTTCGCTYTFIFLSSAVSQISYTHTSLVNFSQSFIILQTPTQIRINHPVPKEDAILKCCLNCQLIDTLVFWTSKTSSKNDTHKFSSTGSLIRNVSPHLTCRLR